jgi:hypothetical protein
MSVNDWFGPKKFWKLDLPTPEVSPLFATGQGPSKNRFELKPKRKDGQIVYFTVDFKGTALPAAWKKVRLFPRGDTPVPPPAPALPAQPTPQQRLDAIKDARQFLIDHGASTERLDGQIDTPNGLSTLTLIQIPDAIPYPPNVAPHPNAPNGEALLCLFTEGDDKPLQGQASNPDGTGGGSSGHH